MCLRNDGNPVTLRKGVSDITYIVPPCFIGVPARTPPTDEVGLGKQHTMTARMPKGTHPRG